MPETGHRSLPHHAKQSRIQNQSRSPFLFHAIQTEREREMDTYYIFARLITSGIHQRVPEPHLAHRSSFCHAGTFALPTPLTSSIVWSPGRLPGARQQLRRHRFQSPDRTDSQRCRINFSTPLSSSRVCVCKILYICSVSLSLY